MASDQADATTGTLQCYTQAHYAQCVSRLHSFVTSLPELGALESRLAGNLLQALAEPEFEIWLAGTAVRECPQLVSKVLCTSEVRGCGPPCNFYCYVATATEGHGLPGDLTCTPLRQSSFLLCYHFVAPTFDA